MIAAAVAVCSCSFQQKQDAAPANEVKPKANPENHAKETKSPERPRPVTSSNTGSFSSSYSPGEEDNPLPVSLPGERRGALRTPDMPKSLPLTIEGKVNPDVQ